MARQECPTCRNAGVVEKERQIVVDGKPRTVVVEEKCKPCGGTGWVEGRTGS